MEKLTQLRRVQVLKALECEGLIKLLPVFNKSDLHKKVIMDLLCESETIEKETDVEKLIELINRVERVGAIYEISEVRYFEDSDEIFNLYQSEISDYIKEKAKQDDYTKEVLIHLISEDILITESYTKNRVLGFIYESIVNDIKVILED